jgi:hypothetical protein
VFSTQNKKKIYFSGNQGKLFFTRKYFSLINFTNNKQIIESLDNNFLKKYFSLNKQVLNCKQKQDTE